MKHSSDCTSYHLIPAKILLLMTLNLHHHAVDRNMHSLLGKKPEFGAAKVV